MYIRTYKLLTTEFYEHERLQFLIPLQDGTFDVGAGPPFRTLDVLVEHYRGTPIIDKSGKVVRLKQPINATRIVSANIHERIEDLSKKSPGVGVAGKGGFWEEFEQLQQNECKALFQRKEGAKQENRSKNRFKNILPFDHTRVILTDGEGSDYINANYIKRKEDAGNPDYIATQGALPATVIDFWRMIFQENTRIIVMTTNEIERGRVKCHAYWPQVQVEQTYGQVTVKNLNEYSFPHYVLRELLVHKAPKDGEKPVPPRTVFHYHFKAWPDHGVPQDTKQVLGFLKDVNKRQAYLEEGQERPGPITVHCSAGIGRTGTFIVIDMLLRKIEEESVDTAIDIQKTILDLRKQRSGMVQTEAQYKFIYMAISSEITPKGGQSMSKFMGTASHPQTSTAVMSKNSDSSGPQESAYANLQYLKEQEGKNGSIVPPLPTRQH
jgi:tyrosine-protein phosphatase non-receptor type 11